VQPPVSNAFKLAQSFKEFSREQQAQHKSATNELLSHKTAKRILDAQELGSRAEPQKKETKKQASSHSPRDRQ